MANNCLVTKLNGTVDNDSLPRYGCITLRSTEKVGLAANGRGQRLGINVSGNTKIYVNGDGYFASTFEGLNNPASRMTSYIIPAGLNYIFFKNDNYDIFIEGRYGGISAINISQGSTLPHVISMNIDEFKYDDDLSSIDISLGEYECTGHLSSIAKINSTEIGISQQNIAGSILDVGKCTSLTYFAGSDTLLTEDLISLVNMQIANGRTSCDGLRMFRPYLYAVIGGLSITTTNYFDYLKWTSASHIVLDCDTTIYIKGTPTAEEEAAWAEKTVIEV